MPRIRRTANYELFARACQRLEITPGQLAEHIGYHPSAATKWRQLERIPYAAALACEALLRRQSKYNAETTHFYLLSVPEGKKELFQQLCKFLSLDPQRLTPNN